MSDNERSDIETGDKAESIQFRTRRLTSVVWETFSVADRKNYIARCNICHSTLSFKTTVTNLKKHIVRKHPHIQLGQGLEESFNVQDRPLQRKVRRHTEAKPISREGSFHQSQRHNNRATSFDIQKAKLSDLGGLEGLIINVIGEDGEAIISEENQGGDYEGDQEDVYVEEAHDRSANRTQKEANVDPAEKKRRSRIMELQLECLEIKKYNMQLEALLMEQQLSVCRSIFTQPLQNADSFSRGTQTDVGGEKTRVFYLADGKGGTPRRHLFAMQEEED